MWLAPSDSGEAAADQILEAVRQRDGALRYSQFNQALQTTSSPSMVQGTLDQLPQLESWTIQSVRTGLSGNSSLRCCCKARTAAVKPPW